MTFQMDISHNGLVLTNLATTLFMTGVIWIVQVVHYPLFAGVGREGFPAYAADHNTLITWIVMPAMLIEIGTAFLLVIVRPPHIDIGYLALGFILVVMLWGVTFFLSVPQHGVLLRGFDANAHRALVTTNWVRTILWSARSILMLWVVARLMNGV